ncbi:MAG: sigma 54-interacting transcriptional regulator [Myxococcota bacterium]
MIRLEILVGQEQGRSTQLEGPLLRVGRERGNDLALSDAHVSALHVSIAMSVEGYVLRDHHSTNGTRVCRGEEKIDLTTAPGRELLMQSDDILELGDLECPVRIQVTFDDTDEITQFVSVKRLALFDQLAHTLTSNGELLQGLYEAQKRLSEAIDLDQVLDVAAAQVFRFLNRATHVTVVLKEHEESPTASMARYVPMGTRMRGGGIPGTPIPITRSVFRKVVKDRAAVLAADARREVGETASLMAAEILSTIGVPLWRQDEIIGVLQVDNRDSSGIFREQDLDILALLAQSTSQAVVHARLLSKLRVSEERQRNENIYLKSREKERFKGIIGDSRPMATAFELVRKVVDTRVSVFIEGETGTGKELIARSVHYWSKRKEKLFVVQNCAAIPDSLLESELFGHRKGAFTGANEDKKGLFELAHGGTLFLDEVGEMPLSLQSKLLRALQEGEIRPVGSHGTKIVDVRIVAATHRDLEAEVAEGRFREDLYYRLKVFPIRVPPLRERPEDVPLLAAHFLQKYAGEFGREIGGIGQAAMEVLSRYGWPGNVRELENEIQRLIIQSEAGALVTPEQLSPRIRNSGSAELQGNSREGMTLKELMERYEYGILKQALADHQNNKSATAKTLGMTREGLYKKLKGHRLG